MYVCLSWLRGSFQSLGIPEPVLSLSRHEVLHFPTFSLGYVLGSQNVTDFSRPVSRFAVLDLPDFDVLIPKVKIRYINIFPAQSAVLSSQVIQFGTLDTELRCSTYRERLTADWHRAQKKYSELSRYDATD